MNKPPVTIIILTYNEEKNLKKCLESVKDWSDEIIIVDSYSSDKTREIAESYSAKFFEHPFKYQADQFNWALDNLPIKNEWILRLDADEVMTEELWQEIAEALPKTPPEVSGFFMKRRVHFMGRWIRHGGYYPVWILRLFRKNRARAEDREMDEHIFVYEGRAEKLRHDFIDDNEKPLEDWIAKHNNYSTREARERIKNNQPSVMDARTSAVNQLTRKRFIKENLYSKLPLFGRAFFYFIYRYVFLLGFLDGTPGLIFHFLQGCWHQFLIDAKIYEQKYHRKN